MESPHPIKKALGHLHGKNPVCFSFAFLYYGTTHTHAYLSDSFRSAEVMG